MKMNEADLENLYIQIKLKDGRLIETNNPKTLLFVYQNFDMQGVEEAFKKTGKYLLDERKDDIGGIQIVGRKDNIKFALFTLLQQLLDHLSVGEIIGIVSKALAIKISDIKVMEKLKAHAEKHKNDKMKN